MHGGSWRVEAHAGLVKSVQNLNANDNVAGRIGFAPARMAA